jgi:hypothetical protein
LDWNLAIGRRFSDHQFSVFRPWQKVSHYCEPVIIGRKDEFHCRMKKLALRFGSALPFT